MMRILFNTLNTLRDHSSEKLYNLARGTDYFIRNIIGFLRGFFVSLTGKIRYEDSYRPLILGHRTKLYISPKSKIILKDQLPTREKQHIYNNFLFKKATTIGLRPYYVFLTPPCFSETRIDLDRNSKLLLGKNVVIMSGCYITANLGAEISIADNCYISADTIINARNSITIGKGTLIGHRNRIMDYDGHQVMSLLQNEAIEEAKKEDPLFTGADKPIHIGEHVWIGAGVTIIKGVTIGDNSIIAANSFVISNIPANVIALGNPARVVKGNITWKR